MEGSVPAPHFRTSPAFLLHPALSVRPLYRISHSSCTFPGRPGLYGQKKYMLPVLSQEVLPEFPAVPRSRRVHIRGQCRFLFCFFYINISFFILRLPHLTGFFPSAPAVPLTCGQRDRSCCSGAAGATLHVHFFPCLRSLF